MKKLIFLIMLILLISLIDGGIILANDPILSCDPGCPGVLWNEVLSENAIPLPNCPTCPITVHYKWRLNTCYNPPKFEFVLYDFNIGNSVCQDCINSQYTPDFVVHWVNNYLVSQSNPIKGIIIPGGPCVTNIQADLANCWHSVWLDQGITGRPAGYYYVSCDGSTCCILTFIVCKDASGRIDPYPPQVINYIPSPVNLCTGGCIPICQTYQPKIGFEDEINTTANKESVAIIPNPSDGNLKIQFNVTSKGIYEILITDLKGKTVFENSFTVNSGNDEKELNLKNCPNGSYSFRVTYNGQVIQTGLVLISK